MSPPAPRPPDRPSTRAPRGTRADYRCFLPITLRWMDNDVFGHVNNVHYYSFFDTATCTFLVERGVLQTADSALILVVVESGCRYHSEVAYPGTIDAGLRVARLGSSSVRYEIGIFREGAAEASAEGHFVHVCVGRDSKRPVPMPDAWRAVLREISVEGEA